MDDIEAIQKRPGMYIGDTRDGTGLHKMVLAVLNNSTAESADITSVEIILNPDGSCTVANDGRGHGQAPCLEAVMTQLRPTWDPERAGTIDEVRYLGVAIVNALSDWLEVQTFQDGDEHRLRYERGRSRRGLETVGKAPIVNGRPVTGTRITFRPSREVFEPTDFDASTLRTRLETLSVGQKANVTLTDRRPAA
jgi:DNA gyrase subunit B